jgi:carbon storage regulator
MLFLTRKPGEKVVISDDITVTVVAVTGNRVRVSIDAPDQVRILRAELLGCPDELAGGDGLAEPASGSGGENVRPPR